MSDSVTISIPLLIRLLEFAKEDAKADIELHDIAERACELEGTLDTDDYSRLVPQDKKNLRSQIKEAMKAEED